MSWALCHYRCFTGLCGTTCLFCTPSHLGVEQLLRLLPGSKSVAEEGGGKCSFNLGSPHKNSSWGEAFGISWDR